MNARETIARKLLAALASVTLSDLVDANDVPIVDASGNPLVVTVERVKAKTSGVHLHGYMAQGSSEPLYEDAPTGCDQWWMPFAVGVFVVPLPGDPNPIDTYTNAVSAALGKAVMADPYQGGTTIDTQVLPDLAFPFNAQAATDTGLTFNFRVLYRTRIDDPYTLANG